MLVGGSLIFALVMGLLVVALLRRKGSPTAGAGSESVWVWGFGLAFPMVTLSALTIYGVVLGERLLPLAAPEVVTVRAEARQWRWTFTYADRPGLATEGTLHIPSGRPVDVRITSIDVIHAFWVPRLAGKLDAVPGHENVLRIEATHPGTYDGQSAEFSGRGYREHVFLVQAHDPVSWAAFLRDGAP